MSRQFLRDVILCVASFSLSLMVGCGGGGDSGTAVSSGGAGASSAAVASVRVTPETKQINVGETTTLSAQALDANGAVLTGKTFSFSSINPAVATVSNATGATTTVTGVAQGVVNVFATSEGMNGKAIITVSGQPPIQLSGRVIDGLTYAGLPGARVELENGTSATTGVDGAYSFAVPFNFGEAAHPFKASLTGYLSTTLRGLVRSPSTVLETILLVKSTGLPSSITGAVRNARNNQGIANTIVFLKRGQGGGAESIADRTTDSNGGYSFAGLESGVYTVFAVPIGFKDCSRTTVSLDSNATATQDVFCSPVGGDDSGIRIVLTWGQTPEDLDAHLTGPNASDANRFHVFWRTAYRGSEAANPFARLDTDKTDRLGPETITIKQMNSGVYRYSVHDFTNRNSATSTALGSSQAKVELYLPSALGPMTFYVPNQRGTLWTVFELTGSLANPTVTPRNDMGLATDEFSVP
jgi:Carboxypeptidase regulatory-like domain/Bacterial Ig-like domain (group 2)